jgi:hypothetical protein
MDNEGLMPVSGEPPVFLVCSCCQRTSTYDPAQAKCFDCTIKAIAVSMGHTEKSIKLRKYREAAYQVIVIFVMMMAVSHYFGFASEMICIAGYFVGLIIDPLTKFLARKF